MLVSVDGGQEYPISLWYDKSRSHLYIGEFIERRVIVIDYLKDFTLSYIFRYLC